jgi:hypothetical protein
MKPNTGEMRINRFYKEILKAPLRQAYSWGAYNEQCRLFLRVWSTQYDGKRVIVFVPEWNDSPHGRERMEHIEAMKKGTPAYGVLCMPHDEPGGRRRIKAFDPYSLYELGKLSDDCGIIRAEATRRSINLVVKEVTQR